MPAPCTTWTALSVLAVASLVQVTAFPALYASRRSGCAIPTRGYGAHGSPVESESITFELQNAAAEAASFWEPGETYTLQVSSANGYAWVHASIGTVDAAEGGSQASACTNAWYSDASAASHTVEWSAPASVPTEGQCAVFSTAQAGGSRAAYSTNTMEVCTEGTAAGTNLIAAAPDAAAADDEGLTPKETYRVVHGVLMLLSWGFLIPFAIGEAGAKRADTWFPRHRGMAAGGLLLAVISFIIAISLLHSDIEDSSRDTHRAMGWVVMVLGVLQPANAFFRPHATAVGEKRETKRLLWEVLHKGSGYFAAILAFITMFTGIMLGYSPIDQYETVFLLVLGLLLALTVAWWARALHTRCTKKGSLPDRG